MSKELEKVNNATDLSTMNVVDLGFDSGISDTKSPIEYIRLVQPTSNNPGSGKVGDWVNGAGDVVNDHEFVLVKSSPKRVYFPPGETVGQPLCKSEDGERPSEFVDTPMSDSCKTCQYSKWGADKKPPLCSEVMQYDCLDLTTALPVRIQFKKTGLDAAKQFKQTLKLKAINLGNNIRLGREQNPLPLPVDFFTFTFKLGSMKHKSRPVYIPVIKYTGTVTEENAELVTAFVQQFAQQLKRSDFNILNNTDQEIVNEFEEA